jgi:hypothetical protein
MRIVRSQIRRLVSVALAILVVAALARCSWEEARELAQWSSTVALHRAACPSPIQVPIHDCDQESGCICRGATLVAAVCVNHCQPAEQELIPLDLASAGCGMSVEDCSGASAHLAASDYEMAMPPVSGRQLRALYASLVI